MTYFNWRFWKNFNYKECEAVHIERLITITSKDVDGRLWKESSSSDDNYGIERCNLELNCTVECEKGEILDMKWILPNSNIAMRVRMMKFEFWLIKQ